MLEPTFSSAATPDLAIADFLSRPIIILEQDWADTADFYVQINPWHAFLTNFNVRCKVNNYAYIRGNLHVKFVVNSSPAFYGAALASYYPLESYQGGRHAVDTGNSGFFTPMSQRMHLWLRPQQSQGGEMILPFVHYKNWLKLEDTQELTDFGSIYVSSVRALRNASGVSSASIDITAFAWMTEVELAQTTSRTLLTPPAMEAQSRKVKVDEFKQGYTGPVSSVASTVATVAGRLGDVPVIGPFAKAFEIGGKAVAGIASIFGFSRVPILKPIQPVKNNPVAPLAITDQPEMVDRLTFTSKQGLTVDPRTVGIGPEDELTISSFTSRESFLTTFDWGESTAAKTIIWGSQVTPTLSQTFSNVLYMTPMAYASVPFTYWSGDIIYRFQIICSQYHRGRLLIQFDPIASQGMVQQNPNVVLSQVIDISVTRDFEFRVPYASDRPFLELSSPSDTQFQNNDVGDIDLSYVNGKIIVSVLNRLTSLSGSGDVYIIVSVRGAENMKYHCPSPIPPEYSLYPVPAAMEAQSGVMDVRLSTEGAPVVTTAQELTTSVSPDEHIFDVFFGEQIVSFRSLLKRYQYAGTYYAISGSLTAGNVNFLVGVLPRFPLPHGYVPSGPTNGVVSSVNHPFNFIPFTLFSYLQNCFLGMRGGMRWKITPLNNNVGYVHYGRTKNARGNVYVSIQASVPTSLSQGTMQHRMRQWLPDHWEGAGLLASNQIGVAEFEIPHYSQYRFYSTCPGNVDKGDIVADGSNADSMAITMIPSSTLTATRDTGFNMYCATGDDFNFFWFQGVPTIYLVSQPALGPDRTA